MLKYKVKVTYLVEAEEVVDVVAEDETVAIEAACQVVEDQGLGEAAQGTVIEVEKVTIGGAVDGHDKNQLKLI